MFAPRLRYSIDNRNPWGPKKMKRNWFLDPCHNDLSRYRIFLPSNASGASDEQSKTFFVRFFFNRCPASNTKKWLTHWTTQLNWRQAFFQTLMLRGRQATFFFFLSPANVWDLGGLLLPCQVPIWTIHLPLCGLEGWYCDISGRGAMKNEEKQWEKGDALRAEKVFLHLLGKMWILGTGRRKGKNRSCFSSRWKSRAGVFHY